MSHRLKPVSRLTLVFVLAVIVSGSILTWFSINNIANLKELTEKRILEEEHELALRFSVALQEQMDSIISGFGNRVSSINALRDSLLMVSSRHDFIKLPFILNPEGHFLYPNFIGIPENLQETKQSRKYRSAFREGEQAEFRDHDLRRAGRQYLLCLNYSMGGGDSAKAFNALGRIHLKSHQLEKAIEQYASVIAVHSAETGDEGVVYASMAVSQLVSISNGDNRGKILPVIISFLEKTERGLVPMSFHTEDLLVRIMKWLQENTLNEPEIMSHATTLDSQINQQLRLIDLYGGEIRSFLNTEMVNQHDTTPKGFKMVSSFSGTYPEIILIQNQFNHSSGFLLDRKKLFETTLSRVLQTDLEFDYSIEFPDGYSPLLRENELFYTTQLNPVIPGQTIQIKPVNENVITGLIERRSWIYGIATVLLLVAMMLGVVMIIRDINREKHLAQLRADFISNVTHELKTPLTSIYMYAESLLLDRIRSTTGKKEYLSVILKESDRLKRMINNILEFSKMEKGKSEYQFIDTNLATIVKAVLDEMDYWFEKEQFEVNTELDNRLYAEVDPGKMKQAISNLLSNALKYSVDRKKITIRLYQEGKNIYIDVEDLGIGIAKNQLSRIFEKFYRVNQQASISGTGLGLTVVREIAEAHHGSVEVSSEVGKGSKFSIILKQQKGES